MKLGAKQYAHILDSALSEHPHSKEKIVSEFVELVRRDGKLSKINDILTHFKKFWNKRHDIVDVDIETADKNHLHFTHEIKGKKLELNVKENKDLIGGSIVRIGDYIIDNSIKSKINHLKN